jgi:hypothetical protein
VRNVAFLCTCTIERCVGEYSRPMETMCPMSRCRMLLENTFAFAAAVPLNGYGITLNNVRRPERSAAAALYGKTKQCILQIIHDCYNLLCSTVYDDNVDDLRVRHCKCNL